MKKLWDKRSSTIFAFGVFVSVAVYLLCGLFSGGQLLTAIFFRNTEDAFMDFFNSVRDAAQGIEAYTVRKVIYPPMANLIFRVISFFTPDEYNQTLFADRLTWSDYGVNVAWIIAFLAVCVLGLALLVFFSLKRHVGERAAFTAAAVVGVPFLNMLERGNIMVLAFLSLMIFWVTYDHKSAAVRELGLLALAFSFSIKLYPILFAWVLIGDKRYREFFRCALYSLILLIVPSFAFGGPSCLLTIVENILSFSSGSGGVIGVISSYTRIPASLISVGAYIWFVLCGLNFAFSVFFYRDKADRWKIWTLGCIAFLAFPSLTSTYAWALFLIPLLALYNEEIPARKTLGYLIPITVPFLLLPIPFHYAVTMNAVAVYVCLFAVSAYALFDTIRAVCLRAKEKKEKKESNPS